MNEEQFQNRKWKNFEIIEFIHERKAGIITECLLLAIDFEQGLLKLEPLDKELYEDKSFWCRYEYCKTPLQKLKVSK